MRTHDNTERGLLRGVLRAQRGAVAWSVLGGLVYQLSTIGFPWLLGRGIDQGVVARDRTATVLYGAGVAGLVVVAFAGSAALSWWSTAAATRAGNALRHRLLTHVLRLDSGALRDLREGDLVTRGSRDVDQIRAWLAGAGSALTGAVGFVAILAMIAMLDPLLALVGLATVPVLAVAARYFPRVLSARNSALSRAHADRAGAVDDVLAAGTALRGIGSGPALLVRHHAHSAAVTGHSVRVARATATWNASVAAVPGLATAVGLLAGGFAVLDGRLGVGGLVAFTSWMAMLRVWVAVLALRITQLVQARTAAGRLAELFALRPEMPGPEPGLARPLPRRGALHAKGLPHRWHTLRDERHAVRDQRGGAASPAGPPGRGDVRVAASPELHVDEGEFVAVTGALGSGKSTLARQLGGLAHSGGGRVTFGDVDLADAGPEEVRARICVVPQHPVLFSGTLAENLVPDGRPCEADEMRAACRVAAVDEWVTALPSGFDTPVGEGGGTLSGGQRQRLGLARALLARPAVLVLDDVTSAVDTATEARMLQGLRALPHRPTVVFLTLREGVAAAADRVLGIEGAAADGDGREAGRDD